MSWQASGWALKESPAKDCQAVVILMAIADHAHPDGTAAWPSQATIADYARCSIRTVQRRLAELEAYGLIRRGDQNLVSHLPKMRRPIVWDLALEMTRQPDVSLDGRHDTGDGSDTTRVTGQDTTPVSYKPSFEPSLNHPYEQPRISGGIPPSLAALRSADLCPHEAIVGQCALCRTTRTIERPQPRSAPRCQHGEPIHRHPDCVAI